MLVWQCGQPSNSRCLHCGKRYLNAEGDFRNALEGKRGFLLASMSVVHVLAMF